MVRASMCGTPDLIPCTLYVIVEHAGVCFSLSQLISGNMERKREKVKRREGEKEGVEITAKGVESHRHEAPEKL